MRIILAPATFSWTLLSDLGVARNENQKCNNYPLISALKRSPVERWQNLKSRTSFAHWVPFPDPGPPVWVRVRLGSGTEDEDDLGFVFTRFHHCSIDKF